MRKLILVLAMILGACGGDGISAIPVNPAIYNGFNSVSGDNHWFCEFDNGETVWNLSFAIYESKEGWALPSWASYFSDDIVAMNASGTAYLQGGGTLIGIYTAESTFSAGGDAANLKLCVNSDPCLMWQCARNPD